MSRDFDRPLSKRGHKAGKVMGRYLKAEKISWDVALVSPAARTLATVDRLELGYGAPCYALEDERLYMASTHQLLYIVRAFDDMFRSALVIGHNPGIQSLVLSLLPDTQETTRERGRIDAKYPTAALTIIDFTVNHWADIAAHAATLDRFVKPRDLKHDARTAGVEEHSHGQ